MGLLWIIAGKYHVIGCRLLVSTCLIPSPLRTNNSAVVLGISETGLTDNNHRLSSVLLFLIINV